MDNADFDAIRALCEDASRVRVTVRREPYATEAEARAALGALKGVGWVCGVSETPTRGSGEGLPPSELLSAEVAMGNHASVQLRYVGERWVLTTITESATEGEHECVAFEVSYLTSLEGASGMKMKYRVFWRLEPDDPIGVWRPWVARFVEWEEPAGRG